ncbi:hypothetical protein B7P43_G06983 [Cryptotermes secundus]|uniref:Gamma-tubulin complex component 6 n=2 Tax=Cryptotermes secundus TaxID=105785 RepID=A0A2J7Q8Y4_9NEOP|nr:gamma-tubulin complex component 6 isoform X2 [Cryptotermes secundus]XP_023716037.1 gamma-tubulin complex component 6 isoform X2 [Cryptotermes secundus]PNF25042.1 hypothetical protein B7P43_G06983 [Cryptotermes secundus]
MATDSDSVYELVTQLCEKIMKEHIPSHSLEHHGSNKIVKGLRALSYAVLLNKSYTSCPHFADSEEWDAVSQILAYSYTLHQHHLTVQAVKLYNLMNSLVDTGWGTNATLRFLASLAGEVQICPQNTNMRMTLSSKDRDVSVKGHSVNIPMLEIPTSMRPYQEFPPEMFEPPLTQDIQMNSTNFPFTQEPGVGLSLLGTFAGPIKLKQHPKESLNIPDLTKPRDLVIPKEALSEEQQFKDEGYISPSPQNTMTASYVNNGDQPWGIEVWEMALAADLPVRRTWEAVGCLDPLKEKPFLTESGVDCVQKFWTVSRRFTNMSLAECMGLRNISCKQLIQDLKLLLIGVPSQTFQYNQEENGFVMNSNTCVEGLTPETLHSFCDDFLISGMCCLRLRKLVDHNLVPGSHMQEGLMFQALCGSVRSYLQFYRAAVMKLSEKLVLTDLRLQVDSLKIQITSLGHLYKVHPNMNQQYATLPEGVGLLSYLYKELCKVTRKDVACILYSALQACCQVYFSFLQKWMFEGLCQDAYTEFFIQEQPDLMTCRQRDYWSHGYYMLEEAVPGFLRGLESAIFECGKAVNLLKLCNPQDPLCVVLQNGYPNMHCCLHSADLQKLEAECLSYQSRAMVFCGQPLDLSCFFQCMKEDDSLQDAARVTQQATLQRLKLEHDMKASQALAEKQSQLAMLKEQMEMAEAHKAAKKKQQMEEDERRAQEEAELEQETARRMEFEKADLVRYYSSLSEVAEKCRQRAEWRIKHMNLQEQRLDLMSNDTEPVTTIRSPNNNEDLQDINSNLSNMNVLNKMDPEDTGNNNVDTQNNTETMNTFITNYKMKLSDVQSHTEASDREINVDTNSYFDVCLTQCHDNKTDSEMLPSCANTVEGVTDNESNKVEQNKLRDEQMVEVVLEPQISPTNVAESVNSNTLSGTTIAESESHTTLPTDSKSSVINVDTPISTNGKLSVTDTGTDQRFICRLQMSLEDVPLVNITDSVIHPMKNSTSVSAVDVDSADMSSINVILRKSILIPLKIQTSLVNSALLKFFLQGEELLSHLHSLRNYFFLLDGDFGSNITSMLFERMYQVMRPVDLLNCVTLNSILSKAVMHPDPNSDKLSFGVKYVPPRFSFSSPLLLDCITLQYKVAWPINIIFTDAALRKYDDIFGYLLRLRHISWVLEGDFRRLKKEAKDRPGLLRSPQYHRLQLYRHEMMHFMHTLQNYVTATVLQGSWVELFQNLQNARTLDDLYRMHTAYVKMVLFRCLLNKQSASIQKSLLDAMRMILKFHAQIHSKAWQYSSVTSQYEHPRFSTLVQIYTCFHDIATFIFRFASKLANTGYQPCLNDLLLMLNINGFYPEHC